MTQTPLVSAIVPSYNYGRFVCEAVDSVLAQTCAGIECIVVDDGSVDDTRSRLSRYGDRVLYVWQENRGLSAARNTGIRLARGEWVALLDADDFWHARKTEIQLRAADTLEHPAFIGASGVLDVLPAELPSAPAVTPIGLKHFLSGTPFGPSSVMVRRRAFDEVGLFDETLRSSEDRDMWLRLAARFPTARVEANCWVYRQHPAQMSRRQHVMQESLKQVLSRFFARHPTRLSLRRLGWSYYHLDTALALIESGERWRASVHLAASLLRHPEPFPGSKNRLRALAGLLLGAVWPGRRYPAETAG